MANVIREDVVKIGFDVDIGGLSKLDKEMNKISGGAEKSLGKDPFSNLTKGGKNASKNVQDVGQKLQNAALKAKTLGTAMKDMAKASFEKLKSGLKTVVTKLGEIAKKAGGAAYKGLKKLAGISFKALGAGLAGAATGLGVIVGQATKSFADYQQLVGGVEKLFGDAAGAVQNYARDAFSTAGLSTNQYMETVTSFSASLITSLGGDTAKAAELANTAISDMSDNANVFGTDMETIIGTYQSLAKGNFAMLDNLKLGYGGTKTEMEKLIKKAASLDDSVKENDMSFANMVKAINAVQKDMKIYGTTANEAATTVEGSLKMTQAAWKNLLTAFGTGEGIDKAIDDMISSAETFGNNIIPVIERALAGIGVAIEKLAPMLAQKLPGLIQTLLPPLIKAAGTLIASLVANLPAITSSLLPAIKEAGVQIVSALYEGFTGKELDTDALDKVKNAVDDVVNVAKYAIPIIGGAVLAFKGFNKLNTGAKALKKVAKSISEITNKVSGGLGEKISGVGDKIQKTGNKSKTSSKNMLAAAKSFMMLGAGVLMVSIGLGVLAFSAIKLASAGPLAIGVMFGLVVALAALGFGMGLLLKSISSVGAKAIPAATAMLILGAGVLVVAVGFMLLTQAAIALSGAGGAAIAVMFGMVACIAILVAIVGAFGAGLIAGAVGFVIFSAGLLLCSAAAYVFAMAVERMTPPLLLLIPVVGQVVTQIVTAIGTTLVSCIQAAGTAISGILDSIGNIFLKFGEGVKTIVTGIGDAISGVLDSIAGIFDSIGNAALNAGLGFEKVANGLRMISEMSLTELIASLGSVGKALGTLAENGEGLTLAGQGMQTLVVAFMSLATTGTIVSTVLMTISNAVNQLSAAMPNLAGAMPLVAAAMASMAAPLTTVASQFMLFAGTVTSTVGTMSMMIGIFGGIVAVLAALASVLTIATEGLNITSEATKQLGDTFEAIIKKMVSATQSGTAQILALIKQMLSGIQSSFKSVNLQSVGEQMMNGLIRGINNKRAELISLIRSVANEANREWQAIQAIHSPSKVWEQFGEYQIEGNIVGIENKLPQLRRAVDDVGEAAIPYSGRYSPEKVTYTNSRTSNSEYNSYSPVFNFNISGNGDVRATQRAVKRAAKEALREMFESMDRRSPSLQRI